MRISIVYLFQQRSRSRNLEYDLSAQIILNLFIGNPDFLLYDYFFNLRHFNAFCRRYFSDPQSLFLLDIRKWAHEIEIRSEKCY